MRVLAVLLFASLAGGASVEAMTLGDAVELALRSDPTFLAAQSSLEATLGRSGQARASLLPQLTAVADTNSNRRSYTMQNALNNGVSERYNSNSMQLKLTQPLWNHASLIAWSQSELVVGQAGYQYAAAEQDLLVRLIQAWFETMQARDAVMLSEMQMRAAMHQAGLAERGSELGVVSQAELEDAHSKYKQAQAELVAAKAELGAKLAVFELITGTAEFAPPSLSDRYNPPSLGDEKLEYWLDQADQNNPLVLAARRGLEAASEEVRKQRAGHEPTLELVASHGSSAQGSGTVVGQSGFTSNLDAVGVQFNLPLYTGGGQSAKVREAIALRDKAEHELVAALRNARKDVKQAWFAWQAGRARHTAAQQAMKSAAFALKAAEVARSRGVKAELDVLQAQQHDALARRDWRKACYDMINSYLKLRATIGQLTQSDFADLEKYFE